MIRSMAEDACRLTLDDGGLSFSCLHSTVLRHDRMGICTTVPLVQVWIMHQSLTFMPVLQKPVRNAHIIQRVATKG